MAEGHVVVRIIRKQALKGFPEALGAGWGVTVNKFFENNLTRENGIFMTLNYFWLN